MSNISLSASPALEREDVEKLIDLGALSVVWGRSFNFETADNENIPSILPHPVRSGVTG